MLETFVTTVLPYIMHGGLGLAAVIIVLGFANEMREKLTDDVSNQEK